MTTITQRLAKIEVQIDHLNQRIKVGKATVRDYDQLSKLIMDANKLEQELKA